MSAITQSLIERIEILESVVAILCGRDGHKMSEGWVRCGDFAHRKKRGGAHETRCEVCGMYACQDE